EDEDGCPDYDNDKDGVPDTLDKCPDEPEDLDGFEDEDGCPDFDNDKDGIPDSLDQCPNSPEDFNGIEDEDGCPEDDRDGDGIHDGIDLCPDEPEDHDGFEDEDGCPDPDNDGDGIPDDEDKCPDDPEDVDGFEDEDGCPDPDNDDDGVCDPWVVEQGLSDKYADICTGSDECPEKPETHNGYKDEDGCPDTLMKPTEKEEKQLNTSLRAINFKTASAEIMSASHTSLDFVAKFLKQYPHLRYEIQGHTDSQGKDEYNLLLSAARAASVRDYLLSKGVPEDRLIAIGYGEGVPVADNTTAAGRAANRRVEFVIIETPAQYDSLKKLEADLKAKIGKAKIKGFR
ncbi:MAG: OmpA family protein, partial [Fibrobacterota bacterium]